MITKKQFQKIYIESIQNPEKFWADVAETSIEWFKKWDKVFEWKFPSYKWFVGGKLNVAYNCLDRHVKAGLREKTALIYLNENNDRITINYNNLLKQVNKFANGLKSLGVKKGDRVLIYMPLVIEQVVAMLACARIGAIHSVVFAGFSANALRERAEDLKAKVVITASWTMRRGEKKILKSTVREAVKNLEFVKNIIVLNRDKKEINSAEKMEIDFYDLLNNESEICEPEIMNSEDPLFVLYTSGSTGKPKGVVHTAGGFLVYAHYTLKTVFDIKPDDVFWCTADPGWITGHSYVTYGPLSNGLTVVIMEGVPDYPKPDNWYRIIEQEKVNIFYTSPTAIRMFRKYGEGYCKQHDLSSLKILGTVGEPINPEVWKWYHEFIGNKKCPIVDTWWQTETGGHMIVTLPGLLEKPGVAGLPFYGIEAVVVNKSGQEVPTNEKGFLVIKKPWPGALLDCWNTPDRFAKYWNEIGKMFFTGDFAIKDKDGYIQILGRSDDVINVSGHRIGTAEVENALVSFAGVVEAGVISKPDELKGERLKAFLVLKSGVKGDNALISNIKKHVKTKIATIAVPDEIEFVLSLPKTRSGKIMRRVLKAKELGQSISDLTTLED
ncbi:MAG: acetate--CoA ligase [Candidatus Nomurabacteria bacterium]|nr:acetate--CoA ligase [Candidatus Nomurabacteria bacterium]